MKVVDKARTRAMGVASNSKARWIAAGVAAVVLFSGGAAFGSVLPDPTRSDEYVALNEENTELDESLASMEEKYRGVRGKYAELLTDIQDRERAVDSERKEVEEREAAAASAQEKVKAAEAAVKKREDAASGAEAKQAANTVAEGTWTVGVDIEPGTYRTKENVGSSCYWGIYTTGTNGDDIQANDIPGGGRPMVTLVEGQDFTTRRCGAWQKQ
ncbi:hypothetical protein [Arthrobacter subterraneus]|nr:hypothetical protein [Arthrobacter subterraneus]